MHVHSAPDCASRGSGGVERLNYSSVYVCVYRARAAASLPHKAAREKRAGEISQIHFGVKFAGKYFEQQSNKLNNARRAWCFFLCLSAAACVSVCSSGRK
jgi:hypothetical protein